MMMRVWKPAKTCAAVIVMVMSGCVAGDDSPASADTGMAGTQSPSSVGAPSGTEVPGSPADTVRIPLPATTAQPADPPPATAGETQKSGGMGTRVPPPSPARDSAVQPKFEMGPDGKMRPIKR